MNTAALLAERLRSHGFSAPAPSVATAAQRMLAVQSQDFAAGRWALAARTRGSVTLADVDAEFDRGELVRAWTMRGTLHIVPAADLRWILEVTADRQRRQAAGRQRDLGIDDEIVATAERALRPALRDGGCTRAEVFALLEGVGIDPANQRGIHLLYALSLDGVICQGPVVSREHGVSREQLFVLAEEHLPETEMPDDPLAELFVRYIAGHGPAGVADFAWWSGLTLGSARDAVDRAAGRLREAETGLFVARKSPRRSPKAASVHALGAFDEYYISYADRTAACAPENLAAVGPGKNGMVRPVVLADGRVVGVWSPSDAAGKHGAATAVELFADADETSAASEAEIARAVERYVAFLPS